jgi:PAS domain S-box-containing protein
MSDKQWKIVLIDDEEGIRKVMSIALADAGYDVQTAADGVSGVRLCREINPQIVITDIRMPGMNGLEVLQRVKEADPDKEVIVITAFGDIDVAVRALQLDASDFITKPIHDEALWVALRRAKERYTTRRDLRDYTSLIEEKWMETSEKLAQTFNFQRNLIESSMDGIMACDESGRVITFNRSLEQMLGYAKEEVIGSLGLDHFFAVGETEKFRGKLRSEEYGGRNRLSLFETTLVSREGGRIPVQLSATVLFEAEKEIGIVWFVRDLREIRRLEQEFADQARLLQQDKMIALGKLAASVVHEINNPLSGILNYIRLMIKILSRGVPVGDQVQKFRDYLGLMESETSRCSKIVSNLLAFARQSKMDFAEIDVNDLLQKCILLSEHKLKLQNIQVQTRFDPQVPCIQGDFNQVQQCVFNLILNAVDAMPEGGLLIIESSLDDEDRAVRIRVEDTGCGIAREDLPHIFEPFFTTKKEGKGIGLGLSTVYGIVERHKGSIRVASEVGKGTVFTMKFPVP